MHFLRKISFKSALESFASVSGHLRTALKRKINIHQDHSRVQNKKKEKQHQINEKENR